MCGSKGEPFTQFLDVKIMEFGEKLKCQTVNLYQKNTVQFGVL